MEYVHSVKNLAFGALVQDELVDLWTVPIQLSTQRDLELEGLLSADELQRAATFRFDELRASFIQCRATLRLILSRYLGRPARDVRFSYHHSGKPFVESEEYITFNISHSNDLLVLAFAHRIGIGVDVEFIRPLDDLELLAQTALSSHEIAALNRLDGEQRTSAFYQFWTRQEAYLKAIGLGLQGLPVNFGDLPRSLSAPRRLFLREDVRREDWMLQDLSLDSRYAGALIYQSSPRPVRYISLASTTSIHELR